MNILYSHPIKLKLKVVHECNTFYECTYSREMTDIFSHLKKKKIKNFNVGFFSDIAPVVLPGHDHREFFFGSVCVCLHEGVNTEGVTKKLMPTFCKQASSGATVFKWYNEFKRGWHSLEDETLTGHPVTSADPQKMQKLQIYNVETNQRSIDQCGADPLQLILHKYSDVCKQHARWVLHALTDEQKIGRMQWYHFVLHKFSGRWSNSKLTWDIFIDYETWEYPFDLETKHQSAIWMFPGDHPTSLVKFKRLWNVEKWSVAYFFVKAVVAVHLLHKLTVNTGCYMYRCRSQVF